MSNQENPKSKPITQKTFKLYKGVVDMYEALDLDPWDIDHNLFAIVEKFRALVSHPVSLDHAELVIRNMVNSIDNCGNLPIEIDTSEAELFMMRCENHRKEEIKRMEFRFDN